MEKFEEVVDLILPIIQEQGEMRYVDVRNNIYKSFKYLMSDYTDIAIKQAASYIDAMVNIGLVESYYRDNKSAKEYRYLKIGSFGTEILIKGSYSSHVKEEQVRAEKEDEKLEHDLWLAKMSRKWFWWAAIIGLIGGICGIISLIYQISE